MPKLPAEKEGDLEAKLPEKTFLTALFRLLENVGNAFSAHAAFSVGWGNRIIFQRLTQIYSQRHCSVR